MIRKHLPSQRLALSPQRHGKARQTQKPAGSDVHLIQKSDLMIKVVTDTGREAWQHHIFLFRNSGWICRKQNGQQAWWGQRGQGRAGSYGGLWLPDSFLLPSPRPAPAWVGKELPLLPRTHRGIQRPLCCGALAPGVCGTLYPSARHMGSEGALSYPVFSPRAWASSPVYVPGKQIWMESWSLLPKSCPFKQSQAFWNYPHLLLSSMLVITRLGFVGVAEPIQPNSGLSWRCVLIKRRKSSGFNLWR